MHHGIEGLRNIGFWIVIDATFSENVGNLLVDAPFTGSDGTYPLQQFQEVIFAEDLFALLQAIIVQHKPFADVLIENLGGPDAELGRTPGTDPIADGDDGVQAVVPESTPDGASSFVLNYREILGSCRLLQFSLGVDILEVQADVIRGGLEYFSHQALRQPERLGVDENSYMDLLIITRIEEKWRIRSSG